MNNKKDYRPGITGQKEIQYDITDIGLVGYKACGCPVVIGGEHHES